MSPQEAAELLDVLKEHHSIIPATHKAMSLAVAALEREAKAEPVAWEISYPAGGKTITTDAGWIKYLKSYPGHIVTPLYASPPPPASQVRDIPEGWVMVPVEPTEAMIDAGSWLDGEGTARCVWADMIEASPPAPESE